MSGKGQMHNSDEASRTLLMSSGRPAAKTCGRQREPEFPSRRHNCAQERGKLATSLDDTVRSLQPVSCPVCGGGATFMTERHHIDLKQVERGIEEALRSFAGNGRGGSELSKPTAEEPIEKIGTVSAVSIVDASELTARDIEAAGEA